MYLVQVIETHVVNGELQDISGEFEFDAVKQALSFAKRSIRSGVRGQYTYVEVWKDDMPLFVSSARRQADKKRLEASLLN